VTRGAQARVKFRFPHVWFDVKMEAHTQGMPNMFQVFSQDGTAIGYDRIEFFRNGESEMTRSR
jgi:hypothetical protein